MHGRVPGWQECVLFVYCACLPGGASGGHDVVMRCGSRCGADLYVA